MHGHLVHNKRARGGPVYAGRGQLVGESIFTRPEYFIPRQSGYVLTRQNAMRALAEGGRMGGNQFNFTINTNAPHEPIIDDFNIIRAWAKG